MKLYNIFKDIILEEISKEQSLLNEGNIEDINKAMDNTVYVWFKYQDKNGLTTDRYGAIDKLGTSKSGNLIFRFWQTAGKTAKNKKNNKVEGSKTFRVDRIVPGSIKLTNMKYNVNMFNTLGSYNPTGDKLMTGNITIANYKK
jgi:hypothetical protein